MQKSSKTFAKKAKPKLKTTRCSKNALSTFLYVFNGHLGDFHVFDIVKKNMEIIKAYWPLAKGIFNDIGEKNLILTAAGVAFLPCFPCFLLWPPCSPFGALLSIQAP